MMEKRQQVLSSKEILNGERIEFSGSSQQENPVVVRKKEKDEEWMNLPDRI
jgi:hypothetical protein